MFDGVVPVGPWVSPRIRTGYAFRHAAGMIDEIIARLKAIGADCAPITDTASTFGYVKYAKAAKEAGLKAIFGVELAVTQSVNAKKPINDYWTFLATGDVGAINRLVMLATSQFRYEPLLTYEQAQMAEGVIKIAGNRCLLSDISPAPGLYLGLSPSSPRGQIIQAVKANLNLCAVSDNRYPTESDLSLYELVCGRNASTQTYPQHILSEEEYRAAIEAGRIPAEHADRALASARAVLGVCQARLRRATLLKPDRPATLRTLCERGAVVKGCDLADPVYKARLDRELSVIEQKGFEDYFYIVADVISWARKNMTVGPARGSAAGSLVSYLLDITSIDPLPAGLIFERFIDVTRADLPDIDVDFEDNERHRVFEYIDQKYGAERVARLGTVGTFKPKSALQEVGIALRIPKWKTDAVAESMIHRASGDSRALQTIEDTLTEMPAGRELMQEYPEAAIIGRMEGHPRNAGQHAAGVLLSQEPIVNIVAIDSRTGAAMADKKDAEDAKEGYGLLKIDILGLTQLSIFSDCLRLAGLPPDTLMKIPYDDPKAFAVLNDKRYAGIFQFDGIALKSIARQIDIDRFSDVVSITALARPGPLASGGTTAWVKRRTGQAPVVYPHEMFIPYLEETLGEVLYQEQILTIGREIGDLDWPELTELRRAMSRSLGKEHFDRFGNPFKAAAIAKGVDPQRIDKIWDNMCAYGSMAFNKSHAYSYGVISYQCMWLKAHYPLEFIAATLSHEGDPQVQIALLRDIAAEGYDYVPVDPEKSIGKWSVADRDGKKVLIGPLTGIKGIGPKAVQSILDARGAGLPLKPNHAKLLANPKTDIDSLFPIRDSIRRVCPDLTARKIFTEPTLIGVIEHMQDRDEILVVALVTKINPRDENEVIMIQRRGGKRIEDGMTASLNLQLADDSGTVFAKITRYKYDMIGKKVVDYGRPGKALYAVKGNLFKRSSLSMIMVNQIRHIGDLDR